MQDMFTWVQGLLEAVLKFHLPQKGALNTVTFGQTTDGTGDSSSKVVWRQRVLYRANSDGKGSEWGACQYSYKPGRAPEGQSGRGEVRELAGAELSSTVKPVVKTLDFTVSGWEPLEVCEQESDM